MILMLLPVSACNGSPLPLPNAEQAKLLDYGLYNTEPAPAANKTASPKPNYSSQYIASGIVEGIEVDAALIYNAFSDVNFEYAKGLTKIRVMRSNPEHRMATSNGLYYADTNEILIYHWDEGEEWVRHIALHEMKHHWCWYNRQEQTQNHQGCFLDTPIDREYGFIK